MDLDPVPPGTRPVSGRTVRLIVAGLVVAGLLDVAYWVLWATARDQVAVSARPAYVAFEQAFPLADLWLLVCVVAGLYCLLQRRPMTLFWLLAGGGAGVYLMCMDLLYDVEHGIWGQGSNGLSEFGIVIFTAVLSLSMLRWGWRRRRTILDW